MQFPLAKHPLLACIRADLACDFEFKNYTKPSRRTPREDALKEAIKNARSIAGFSPPELSTAGDKLLAFKTAAEALEQAMKQGNDISMLDSAVVQATGPHSY